MQTISKILAIVEDNFGKEFTPTQMSNITRLLSGVDIKKAEQIAYEIMMTEKFLPAPSVWNDKLGGCDDSKAERAYLIAQRAIRTTGVYGVIQFEDRAITATIQALGGWYSFCVNDQEPHWQRKNFIETYRLQARLDIEHAPETLRCSETIDKHVTYFGNDGDYGIKQLPAHEKSGLNQLMQKLNKYDKQGSKK